MVERQPNHIPDPHQAPHEGGNVSPGLPPTLHERAKPPPESSAQGGSDRTSVQQPLERRGALFNCVSLKITIPPHHLRAMVRDDALTEEQAREDEQEWLAQLRASSREQLEGQLCWWEEMRDRAIRFKKPQQVQELEEILGPIREELRKRDS
jgi:hypothetical protein